MKILAFESSCDETSVAIVEDGRRVFANVVRSQAENHRQYGGVVPEVASRQHLILANEALQAAIDESQLDLQDIDVFAATLGPGLVGSLLVGAQAAKTLAFITGKPFRGVNHLHGHIASNYLESTLEPPFLCLLVSGGHCQLMDVQAYDTMPLLGQTLDDAVGETYDKVARVLGLGYPGGPVLDQLAQTGDATRYALPVGKTQGRFDFSFSGLKTATARLAQNELKADDQTALADLAASFQHAAVQALVQRTQAAQQALGYTTVAVAGGVAANSALRQQLADWCTEQGLQLHLPHMAFCTDNAAMIASAAFFSPLTEAMADEVFSRQKTVPCR
ncbi:MAG: tRNA (adenosine(37)-N6)-threonylcarbamoyltransferase complex transferase subunit TsaD [Vampirovibrionales bacterium]